MIEFYEVQLAPKILYKRDIKSNFELSKGHGNFTSVNWSSNNNNICSLYMFSIEDITRVKSNFPCDVTSN